MSRLRELGFGASRGCFADRAGEVVFARVVAIVADSRLEYRNSYAMGRHAASWNSSEFHEIAIFPQPRTASLMAVTLLTGRVYGDGLGGLRAVLFILGSILRQEKQVLHSPHSDKSSVDQLRT